MKLQNRKERIRSTNDLETAKTKIIDDKNAINAVQYNPQVIVGKNYNWTNTLKTPKTWINVADEWRNQYLMFTPNIALSL